FQLPRCTTPKHLQDAAIQNGLAVEEADTSDAGSLLAGRDVPKDASLRRRGGLHSYERWSGSGRTNGVARCIAFCSTTRVAAAASPVFETIASRNDIESIAPEPDMIAESTESR
ncbi:MAG TPA: hypothetical protein VGP27_26020, partial [Mycobacterium sp.]|nr:hypothetical protein [Mycobacterium sp.]